MSDYSQLRKSLGLSAASTRRLRKENNLSKKELYDKMYTFANPNISKIQGVQLALPDVQLPKKQYNNASVEIGEISGPVHADTGEAIGYKLVKVTRPKPLSEKEKQRQERAAREEAFWRGEIDAPSVSDWVKLRDAKYEGLTDLQIRDYGNWKKMGYGNTVDEYKQWLAKEHKSNLDTVKIAKAAATGIVGTAAGAGLTQLASPIITPTLLKLIAAGAVADYSARKGLDTVGVDKDSYIYKTLPIFASALAGGVTKALPEYFTLKSLVNNSPEAAKALIKKGVSASAQNSNSVKELLMHEGMNAGLGSLPAVPISQGLQHLGVNETVSDLAGAGLGGMWGAANTNRAYQLTTGTGGQIGIKNVVKNYLTNGLTAREVENLSTSSKIGIGLKLIGKAAWNTAVPIKNWSHGGYSGVYETDLGATSSRTGDMVRRAPKGVTGPVDAAFNSSITPTGTYNLGDYMGGQSIESLTLPQQLHQGLKTLYGDRVAGNKMMTMFSNMSDDEATKILNGMTVDVDGVATPLVKNGIIDLNVLKHGLRYNADVKVPYISNGNGYRSYHGQKYVQNDKGEFTPVKRVLGKDYARTGTFKLSKINTDVTSKTPGYTNSEGTQMRLFGKTDSGEFRKLNKYTSVKGKAPQPKTSEGIPYIGYGNNTPVGDTYLNINSQGVPTLKTLANDIRGHVDINGSYNGLPMTISLDPYGTGSGGSSLLGRLLGGFFDKNMKRTPVSVNFNTGSNKFENSNATKIFQPFDQSPKRVTGNVSKYYDVYDRLSNKVSPGKTKNSIKIQLYKETIDKLMGDNDEVRRYFMTHNDLSSWHNGGKLGIKQFGI